MSETLFLGPSPEGPRSGGGRSWLTSPSLPPDLAAEAVRRVKRLSGATMVMGPIGLVVSVLVPELPFGPIWLRVVTYGGLTVVSLAVFVASLRRLRRDETLLFLALAYKIFVAAYVALLVNARPWAPTLQPLGWSPVAVWVLLFPLIIPSSTPRTLVSSAMALAMDPLALLLHVRTGMVPMPDRHLLATRFYPHLLALVVSILVARMIHRLGSKLTEARELGSYQLVERLGMGGMGEVWRATHRMLARPAAVKLIRPGALQADAVTLGAAQKRFEREAQATAALRSPHTIDIFDFGVAADGSFYYVMELLEGVDLDSLVKLDGPQPPERVVALLRQACHSLHEAHQAGLVHRDIKPANLFVCKYGADLDFVKVLDFGLVADQARDPAATALTGKHALTGTPAFMAPEMARGVGEVDGRADIYALGCVAYWLLTGEMVFPGETLVDMLMRHMTETPQKPSERLGKTIPTALEALVMECLEKDRERRPRSARELSERLGALGIEAGWTEKRAAEWWDEVEPALRARSRE